MKAKRIIFLLYSSMCGVLGLIAGMLLHVSFNRFLLFAVLDIGQGDSLYIRSPQGKNIVIDGGPDNSAIYALDRYLPQYNRTIDLLILTHPDADHLVAFNEMLERYDVRAVLMTRVAHSSATYSHFLELLDKYDVRSIEPYQFRYIDIENGIRFIVLYPRDAMADQEPEEVNATSVVVRLEYEGGSVLLTGDTTKEVERQLVAHGFIDHATILKVAHHGSDTSSDQLFLEAVQPDIAVISVGKDNKFNHPHSAVLQRLSRVTSHILRTDELGDIVFRLEKNGPRLIQRVLEKN